MEIYCRGDFFYVDKARYYRCSRNGRVIKSQLQDGLCQECNRKIRAQDHGALYGHTQTITIKYVLLPSKESVGYFKDTPLKVVYKRTVNNS